MTVYKAQTVISNYLDVATSPPVNPVDGQKWMDGTVMKTWDEIKKEWVMEDLKGEDGKTQYTHKAFAWSADGTDRFTLVYPNENLVSLKKITSNNYLRNDGVLVANNSWSVSDYLSINGNDNLIISGFSDLGVNPSACFYDSNKNFISGVRGAGSNATSNLKSPINAKFIRYSILSNDLSEEIKIEIGNAKTIYTTNPQDDYENAYPKFRGEYSSFDPIASTNPSDYHPWMPWGGQQGEPGITPKDVISGYLSNESLVISANPSGVVSSFADAYGDFVVYSGQTKINSGVTYSKVSELGMTSTINSSGRYVVTAMSADSGMAIYRAVYSGVTIDKIVMIVKNKQGATGPQGPPTGITTSATVPTNPYIGMLWQNTGTSNGYVYGVTYRWTGAKWDIYILRAENIVANSLSAISANLGDVTGGSFTGGKFINNFVDIPLLYDSTRKATGQTKIENGVMTITGKIDGTYDFVTKYTVDAISSTIYYPNSAAVMKAFSLSPDGLLLADHENGFNGQLLASSLTKMPWVNITVRSGFSVNAGNPPQYKITYNLDGTRTISFRGQVVRLSNNNVISMDSGATYYFADLPSDIRPSVESNGYGVTSSGNGARIWCTVGGWMGCRIGLTSTNYIDIGTLNYIID